MSNPANSLRDVKRGIAQIKQKVKKPDDGLSLRRQFIEEVFDCIDTSEPRINPGDFQEQAIREINKPWATHSDEIMHRELILFLVAESNRAKTDPALRPKLDEIAHRYNLKISTVLFNYID